MTTRREKVVYRLYCEEGLGIRRRKPLRRKSVQVREVRVPVQRANEIWRMDYMSEQLVGGQQFRLLTLVDNHSRESLAIEAGQQLTGDDVVRVLELVTAQRGKPKSTRVDNGPDFCSRSFDLWAYFNGVKLDFRRPEKPTDNAVIESFNGRLRDECLNQHWFLSLDEARSLTEAWREDFNRVRPHASLGHRAPFEFARPVAGHAQLPALHGEHLGRTQVGGGVMFPHLSHVPWYEIREGVTGRRQRPHRRSFSAASSRMDLSPPSGIDASPLKTTISINWKPRLRTRLRDSPRARDTAAIRSRSFST